MDLPRSCPRCRAPVGDLLFSGTTEPRFARKLQRAAPVVAHVRQVSCTKCGWSGETRVPR